MDLDSRELAEAVCSQLWQVTVLILLVALAVRVFARNRPHLAHVLWLVVLVKCVTPPLWSSPTGVFCWLRMMSPSSRSEPVESQTLPDAPVPDICLTESSPQPARVAESPLPDSGFAVPATTDGGPEPMASAAGARPGPGATRIRRADAGGGRLSLAGVATVVWFAGALVLFGIYAGSWVRCLLLLKRSAKSNTAPLAAVVADLCQRLRVRRNVRLAITGGRVGPAVIGWFRPIVILPESVVHGQRAEDLEPVLAHELIHVRRGDVWLGGLHLVVRAVWWFHPLVWWAARRASQEAERCCDEEVIAELDCDRAVYARGLLRVLELRRRLVPLAAAPGVKPVDITSRRLERIMKLGQGCHKRTPWWCWLVLSVAAAVVLPGAAFLIAADPRPADPIGLAGQNDSSAPVEYYRPKRKPEPLSTRVYEVGDVLGKIRAELKLSDTDARVFLAGQLQAACGETCSDGRSILWTDGKLRIRQTDEGHNRITKRLDIMRRFGFKEEVVVEVVIVSGLPKELNTIDAHWSTMKAEVPSYELPDATYDLHKPFDRPLPSGTTKQGGRARVSIEKNLPVMFGFLKDQRATEVVRHLQQSERAHVEFAPKMTIFNGRPATMMSNVQRPFVVGIADGKPQMRVVTEGVTIRLRPLLGENETVRFDVALELSDIRGVEKKTIPCPGGQKPFTVQIPEIATTRLDASPLFPLDTTLLIGGLERKGENGKAQSVLVMLKATSVTSQEKTAGNTDVPKNHTAKNGWSRAADSDQLQGTWEVVSVEKKGKTSRPNEPLVFSFLGQKLVMPDLSSSGCVDFGFRLDPSKQPKWIDIHGTVEDDGELETCEGQGIYRIEGHSLRICMESEENLGRPTSFSTGPKGREVTYVLRRVETGDPADVQKWRFAVECQLFESDEAQKQGKVLVAQNRLLLKDGVKNRCPLRLAGEPAPRPHVSTPSEESERGPALKPHGDLERPKLDVLACSLPGGRVHLDATVFHNEVVWRDPDTGELRVTGTNGRIVQDVKRGEVVQVVCKQDAAGKPTLWAELKVEPHQQRVVPNPQAKPDSPPAPIVTDKHQAGQLLHGVDINGHSAAPSAPTRTKGEGSQPSDTRQKETQVSERSKEQVFVSGGLTITR